MCDNDLVSRRTSRDIACARTAEKSFARDRAIAGTKLASRALMHTTWKLVLFSLALVIGFAACDDDDGSPPPADAPSQDSGPPPLEP